MFGTIFTFVHNQNNTYMDLAGRFLYKSSRSDEYSLIAYHVDVNAILDISIKNRHAQTITNAWKQLHNKFNQSSNAANIWIFDNETSNNLQHTSSKNSILF